MNWWIPGDLCFCLLPLSSRTRYEIYKHKLELLSVLELSPFKDIPSQSPQIS